MISFDSIQFGTGSAVGIFGGQSEFGISQIIMIGANTGRTCSKKELSFCSRVVAGANSSSGSLGYAVGIVGK